MDNAVSYALDPWPFTEAALMYLTILVASISVCLLAMKL